MSDEKKQVILEVFSNLRKRFERRKIVLKAANQFFQIDLAEMQWLAKKNGGVRYLLCLIDAFTKKAFVATLKTKKGLEVANAFRNIIKTLKKPPKLLQSDEGLEFYNREFAKVCKDYGIHHYHTYNREIKAAIVERFILTLKKRIYRQMALVGSQKYVTFLADIVKDYNSTPHSSLNGRTPNSIKTKRDEKYLLSTTYKDKRKFKPPRYRVGDFVRIQDIGGKFEKSYDANYSAAVFKIIRVQQTKPPTYELQHNLTKGVLKKKYYEQQLRKVANENIYLINQVLKRKKNKLFVSWFGLDKKFNSWIDKSELV